MKRKGFDLSIKLVIIFMIIAIVMYIMITVWVHFSQGTPRASSGAFYALIDPILKLF